jgi:two-component system, OmpR family, sensor histidine kinase KdpD
MKDNRPDPEKLLQRVKDEEQKAQRGKLKIYLGAAPGVGKTYTMLQDAATKHAQGLDVVIGVVESHGRKEIQALLQSFEILPEQKIEYHGKVLEEFDLDAALKRNPGLILVDEMAHTNIPGLRHTKRWQDIKELLDRGIDVYTTLNIQHVESLNDVVTQIIHTRVKETVPDYMLEIADTIELVDLPPEELIKRLQEGKVYFPAQAELAADHFFRKGNLIALRELALRTTAERVSAQVLLYRQGLGIQHIWPTKEKILVCTGSRPGSAKVIRAARRMAASLSTEWIAVHIDVPAVTASEDERNSAVQNLRLAEQLGAQTKILSGSDIVAEIMSFAHEQNVTKIIIGKKVKSRWKDFFFGSLADELIRRSGEIDVYIITGDMSDFKSEIRTPKPVIKQPFPWKEYLISIGIVGIASIINFLLYRHINNSNILMIYLLGVSITGLCGRMGPPLFASVLSMITYEFFFIPDSLSVLSFQYIISLFVILWIAQVISRLTILNRKQAESSRLAEHHTAALHTLSRQLASTRGVDKLLETATQFISNFFDSEVIALLPESNHLVIRARSRTEQILNEKEKGVAQWVFDLGQIAGLGTDTLPFSDAIYVPLLASQGAIGVLRIKPMQPTHLFTPEEMHLLEACANQIALAIEVDRLHEQVKQSELETETDRARSSLLQTVSHDLRTPLAAIMGAASTFTEMSDELDAKTIKKLGNQIYFESEQLNRLINNLLQITYLQSDTVTLQKEPHSLDVVIGSVIAESSKKLGKKPIKISLPDNLPKIPFDPILIEEVLINLVDNAIKFTPANSPIEISAKLIDKKVQVSIEDHGPGIVPDEVNKLFEKFYRGRMLQSERGLGLGLAICRSIIKAHGGDIWAENRPEGGAAFRFTLPCS